MRAHRGLAFGSLVVLLLASVPASAFAGIPNPAVDDSYAVDEDQVLTVDAPGVLGNDTTAPTSCAAAVDTSTLAGEVALAGDGSFTYMPNANFNGETSFTYGLMVIGAVDCEGPYDGQATVTITVNAVNDAPTAVADSFQFIWGQTLNIPGPGVLANDSDVDGDGLTAVMVTNPAHGVLTLAANGGFSYTPAAAPCPGQPDAFSYRAFDGAANSPVRIVALNPAALPCPTPFVSPTPAPTPTPVVTPSPTAEPSPTIEPSPTAEPNASPSPAASASGAPSPNPAPTAVPVPVDGGGGISLPVLLVLVLLAALLAFGAAFYLPRLLGRAGPGGPDGDEPDDGFSPR